MGLVNESIKTIQKHEDFFQKLLNESSEIRELWNEVISHYNSNPSFAKTLRRIRDQTAFHRDEEVFEKSFPDPLPDDTVFAEKNNNNPLYFGLANACILNWIVDYNLHDREAINNLYRKMGYFLDRTHKLLEKLILLRLKGLCLENLHKSNI